MTADTSLEIQASLSATLGEIAERLTRSEERAQREQTLFWQNVHPVPILGPAATGLAAFTGVAIDSESTLAPNDGIWWDVRRLSCWGFTAGSVTVYLNDRQGVGEPLATFPQPGQYTWSGNLFLGPQDRLVALAAGVTGSVFMAGQAIEISGSRLPYYLI